MFVDVSEDFEHVQSPTEEAPGQAMPTQRGGGANEEESEGEEEPELPPHWEERTVSHTPTPEIRTPH